MGQPVRKQIRNIPIVIVNYNTPDMVYYNILSVNKSTPNAKIYVFDNSDKECGKFEAEKFKNVTVMDNTNDQYMVRKDEYYHKFAETNMHGSLMHTKTIQACIDNVPEDGFILLDSDVLIRKNLACLYDEKYICVGGVDDNGRCIPFCCFINSKKCKEKNIKYYDPECFGRSGHYKDTGYSFLKEIKENHLPFKQIGDEYYIHFAAGSYRAGEGRENWRKFKSYEEFLKKNEKYWK